MKGGISKLGLALAGVHLLFVAWGLAIYLAYGSEWALASVFLIVAGLPWSLHLDWLPISGDTANLIALLGVCAFNTCAFYLAGFGLGYLFSPPPPLPVRETQLEHEVQALPVQEEESTAPRELQ